VTLVLHSPPTLPKSYMPSAGPTSSAGWPRDLDSNVNGKLGVTERWRHADGRSVTIPIHGAREIGPPLYNKILSQLGISSEEFRRLT
jgi:hypothetical protein